MRDRISAAGGDPHQIQIEQPARLMRLPEVRRVTGLGTTSIYTLGKKGRFPRPISLDS
ncbi:MAG TPA: AlpA family phage regulatory protein [Steroidobacteraceae bacterium]|jgi:predicted DNA-binding transcriptional regulator AlpA|nr:AlpA family phage regulatory protein [Steroidobacteraceae bacterium]